jgi:hypothetical protein
VRRVKGTPAHARATFIYVEEMSFMHTAPANVRWLRTGGLKRINNNYCAEKAAKTFQVTGMYYYRFPKLAGARISQIDLTCASWSVGCAADHLGTCPEAYRLPMTRGAVGMPARFESVGAPAAAAAAAAAVPSR